MAKIKVRTINREELPGIAILRDAVAADLAAYPSSRGTLDLEMDTDPELRHLLSHDPDGFFTVYQGGETLGFAAAHVRARQCILSELWVLPQHHGRGAAKPCCHAYLPTASGPVPANFLRWCRPSPRSRLCCLDMALNR